MVYFLHLWNHKILKITIKVKKGGKKNILRILTLMRSKVNASCLEQRKRKSVHFLERLSYQYLDFLEFHRVKRKNVNFRKLFSIQSNSCFYVIIPLILRSGFNYDKIVWSFQLLSFIYASEYQNYKIIITSCSEIRKSAFMNTQSMKVPLSA